MTEIMMALGPYRFAVDSSAYQQLVRSSQYRWPSQERIGRRPARQFVGHGEDTVTLSGVVHPHYAGGLGQVDRMREMAGRGLPLRLADGRGKIWGLWCIEGIDETRSVFFANGDPRKIEFSLTLVHYGEDV
jgi:phage protein U